MSDVDLDIDFGPSAQGVYVPPLTGAPEENGAAPDVEPSSSSSADRLIDGAAFILDAPADVAAVWGRRGAVAWSAGEPLMIVGPQGVGKSTLGQRLTLARIGLAPAVLGFPVEPDERPVLYLAADRPRQAQRSFQRMVSEEEREILGERLKVWPGPLPFSLIEKPDGLAIWAKALGVGTVFIDSLKDVALDLSREETGTRVNLAFQYVLEAGIEVCANHHQRKAQGDNKKPTSLSDVYGSNWLTAGCGSILLLWGEAGDVLVELTHLKQPAEEIGPWTIAVDHDSGALAVHDATDVASLLPLNPAGLTAQDAAATIFATATPSKSQVEKARRKLEKLIGEGTARRIDATIPGDPNRYVERST